MSEKLRLYSVTDDYVAYLFKFDKHVLSNKEDKRTFERKYLGTVLLVGCIKYFVPLASPKDNDYMIDKDGITQIRKSIIPIMRMTYKDADEVRLLGKLKFSSMIPVLDSELLAYNIQEEPDIWYRDLLYNQWDFIRANKDAIFKSANVIYKQKTNNVDNIGYLNSTVNFKLLEEKMKEYKK